MTTAADIELLMGRLGVPAVPAAWRRVHRSPAASRGDLPGRLPSMVSG